MQLTDRSFPISMMSRVTFLNLDSHSSSEAGVNPGIRSWKTFLSEWARFQKAIGKIYITKKWRAETLQPGSEFAISNPGLKAVSLNASPCWTVRFFGVMIGVFWKREPRPVQWHQCRLLTLQFLFCLRIYSLRLPGGKKLGQATTFERFCQVKVH
jgi:hypothetical protein